jgi:pyruvate dehydrogenase E2 component (dihydrolipoamide acetyltransferase)
MDTSPIGGQGVTEGRHPVELSRMRAAIGRRMLQSTQGTPHFSVTTELDMGPLLADLDRRNARREPAERLSLTALLVKAVALTIGRHPEFNAVWNGETLELVDAINIGVAIALDEVSWRPLCWTVASWTPSGLA